MTEKLQRYSLYVFDKFLTLCPGDFPGQGRGILYVSFLKQKRNENFISKNEHTKYQKPSP